MNKESMISSATPEPYSPFPVKDIENLRNSENNGSDTCFYNLCDKSTICWGRLPFAKFKNRTHSVFCGVMCLMITALLCSVILPLAIYSLVDSGINEQVVMDSSSNPNFDSFVTNAEGPGYDDIKITYSVYLFNILNANDILGGAQPIVNEVGPYVYDEYFRKFDISWEDHGDTINYNTQKWYVFNPSKSGPGLTEEDKITLPYPSVIGFQYLLDTLPPDVNQAMDYLVINNLMGKSSNLTILINNLYQIVEDTRMTPQKRHELEDQLHQANASQQIIFQSLESLIATSGVGDLLLKSMMCGIPSFLSPFFQQTPSKAWFGWLNDPLMSEVQGLLNVIAIQTGKVIPWSSAIPGAATNYSSIDDARRRRNVDSYKTGKKSKNQVGQYARYQNMTEIWTCISASTASKPWIEGEQFPACPFFQYEWTESEAEAHGYTRPFATEYANGIRGTDANMYGRPVRSDKIQVYVSDIYRSVFLKHNGDMDWNGVTLRKYGIQEKDMLNATNNPDNAQYYAFGYNGMENATAANNIPIYISFPHYMYADAALQRSVVGLHPNPDIHETYLAIEPQTGLLAKAHKRLQVSYLLTNKLLPTIDQNSVLVAETLCTDLQNVVDTLQPFVNGTLPNVTCSLTVITPLFQCLAIPTEWNFQDKLYMPYGWVSEEMVLPDSDADSLQNDLFVMDTAADAARLWSLVVAGGCFLVLLIMAYQMREEAQRTPQQMKWETYGGGRVDFEPDGTMNPAMKGAEPLLGSTHDIPSSHF